MVNQQSTPGTVEWQFGRIGRGVVAVFASQPDDGLDCRLGAALGGLPVAWRTVRADDRIEWTGELAAAVIEVDPAAPGSFERLSDFAARHRGVPIVAAIGIASARDMRRLVHDGVADFVSLPIDPDEVGHAVLSALTARGSQSAVRVAPLVTVSKAGGGTGATTVATNLAVALQAQAPAAGERTLLLDLDIQFGNCGDYLGAHMARSVMDLVCSTERLDDTLIESMAAPACGIEVICAPHEVTPLGQLDGAALTEVIDQCRQTYSAVVMDLPGSSTDASLSIAHGADLNLIVVENSLRSIARAKRLADLFASVGVDRDRCALVLNRHAAKLFSVVKPAHIEDTVGLPILATIGDGGNAVAEAQTAGSSLVETQPKGRLAKDFAALADMVRQRAGIGG